MIPVLLLAKSFLRQNRWLLLAFVALPLLLGAFLWYPHQSGSRKDVAEMVQQEMFYGIAVVTFLASSAIYNEKRSRRIIGVLSKAVSRRQYLLALLLGSAYFALAYFASVGITTIWLVGVSYTVLKTALALFVRGTLASLWAAALGMFLSTLLYPFFAAAVALLIALAPLGFKSVNMFFAPAAVLMRGSDDLVNVMPFAALLSSLGESFVILVLAAQIFARRDVAVSIE